ncbi:MAG: dTMP kinase [Vicinamibacteria bacterium]
MVFVTLEGMEGSGKSTQGPRIAAAFGPDTVLTREPGGTGLGRGIRALLLDPAGVVSSEAEALLYFADRAQNVNEVVRPALAAGRAVVSDRYVDTSLAYQGYARGLSLEALRHVARLATGGLVPDLTLFFDVPIAVGLDRIRARGARDRIEAEAVAFHERARAGYDRLMREDPQRWAVVDGVGTPDEVEERACAVLRARGLLEARGVR